MWFPKIDEEPISPFFPPYPAIKEYAEEISYLYYLYGSCILSIVFFFRRFVKKHLIKKIKMNKLRCTPSEFMADLESRIDLSGKTELDIPQIATWSNMIIKYKEKYHSNDDDYYGRAARKATKDFGDVLKGRDQIGTRVDE